MKKVITILCITGISLILLYKFTLSMFNQKVSYIKEYESVHLQKFLNYVQTGDIIYTMNRFNPRFLHYTLLALLTGTPYMHGAMVIKALDGTPFIVHMQLQGPYYKRYSINKNKNPGGVYLEKLEDFLRVYIKRYKSIFGIFKVKENCSYKFKVKNIISSARKLSDVKFMSNYELIYHIVRMIVTNLIFKLEVDKRRNRAQCNIVLGAILEDLGIFPKADDIFLTYTPHVMEMLYENSGFYYPIEQIKVLL